MQVLIPAPYWTSYPEMASLARAKPVILDCPAGEGYLLTAQQLRTALTPQSRLLILCTPSNPSGAVYSLKQLQVLRLCIASLLRLKQGANCCMRIFCSLARCL